MGYTLASALTVVYLARKPVNLDQYTPLHDSLYGNDEDQGQEQDQQDLEQVQAQYQTQRSSGMGINLARFGLTAFQLGLAFFSLVLLETGNNEGDSEGQNTTFSDTVQITAWTYFLVLSFFQLIRPQLAYQFWLRPQMDLFYLFETALLSYKVYFTDLLFFPAREWPLWFKLEGLSLVVCALLLWVSLVTLPFRPVSSVKLVKTSDARLPSPEYASSLYSQLTFGWVNPLVFLGYKRPLQDVDLTDLEIEDYTVFSIKKYSLVK